jgi:hypothetical protein
VLKQHPVPYLNFLALLKGVIQIAALEISSSSYPQGWGSTRASDK